MRYDNDYGRFTARLVDIGDKKYRWINRLLVPVPVHLKPCGCWAVGRANADNKYRWSKIRVLPGSEIDYRCENFTETVESQNVTVRGHRPTFRCLECGEAYEGAKRYRDSPKDLVEEPDLSEDEILHEYTHLSERIKASESGRSLMSAMDRQGALEKMWRQHGNDTSTLYEKVNGSIS